MVEHVCVQVCEHLLAQALRVAALALGFGQREVERLKLLKVDAAATVRVDRIKHLIDLVITRGDLQLVTHHLPQLDPLNLAVAVGIPLAHQIWERLGLPLEHEADLI